VSLGFIRVAWKAKVIVEERDDGVCCVHLMNSSVVLSCEQRICREYPVGVRTPKTPYY
jgi:hypothetical protein